MKNFKNLLNRLSLFILLVFSSLVFCACPPPDDDLADKVVGTYVGTLTCQGKMIEDVYTISISKISEDAVSVNAKFLTGNNNNFRVSKSGSQYVLSSDNHHNVTMYVTGKTLNVNYLATTNKMNNFSGNRD